MVCTNITCNVITKIANVITVACIKLKTTVEHFTCINPHAATFAHYTNTWHVYKNVGSFLVIPLDTTIESLIEETKIKTYISLGCCFPFNIIVTQLVTLKTRSKSLSTVCTSNVIRCTVALSTKVSFAIVRNIKSVASCVADFLVTSLSPRSTELQIRKP